MATPLSSNEIDTALRDLGGWSFEGDALVRSLTFNDFREAMGAMVRIGFEAETINHHPELRNVYNRVDIRLTTHDAGDKVTDLDLKLARRINAVTG